MGKHPEMRGMIPPGRETERQVNRVILNQIISFICIYFKTYLILFILHVPFVSMLATTFKTRFCHNKVWIQETGKLQVASGIESPGPGKCPLPKLQNALYICSHIVLLDRKYFCQKVKKRICKELRDWIESD